MKPLMDFLQETNSSFLINLYPYDVYRVNPEIPIGFALFQEGSFNFMDDPLTGVRYWNLYDTMVDAVITAIAVAGHESIPVIIAETGWPCAGAQPAEVDANQVYAEMFLRGLIKHLNSGVGTPLRKDGALQVYVYELFDSSHGNDVASSRKSWGILYLNMIAKLHIDFAAAPSSSIWVGRRGLILLELNLLAVIWFCLNGVH